MPVHFLSRFQLFRVHIFRVLAILSITQKPTVIIKKKHQFKTLSFLQGAGVLKQYNNNKEHQIDF